MNTPRQHRKSAYLKVPFTMVTVITLVVSSVGSSAQVPGEGDGAELTADPGNDYFARINQLYKLAAKSKDFKQKDRFYNRLVPMLNDYLKQHPRHKNAQASWYYLAECYYFTGRVRQAITTYKKITSKYKTGPYVAASSYRIARDYFTKSDFMKAAEFYGKTATVSADPGDKIRVRYFQAQAYMQANRSDLATPIYKKVARAEGPNPYREGAALAYGRLGLKKGDYEDALLELEKLITPDQALDVKAEATYYAGTAALQLKKPELAEKYYNMSMDTKTPQWKGQAQTGLMLILFDRENYKGVLDMKQKGNFQMADTFKAQQGYLVGMSCFRLEKYASALDHFIDVEVLDKGSDNAFNSGYYKLLCFYKLKNVTLASKVNRFLQNYAVNRGRHKFIHQALMMKAETLFANQKYADASEVYSSISSKIIDEKYVADVLYKKGICLHEVENHTGTADTMTSFIEKYPDHTRLMEVLLYRASAYSKAENKDKALRDYDHVIKSSKDKKQVAMALQKSGAIQFHNNKHEDMIARFKKLVDEHKDLDPKVLGNANYWIGRAYFKQKKYEESMKYLEASWDLDKVTFKQQISMLRVIGYFSLKKIKETKEAVENAESAAIRKKIPLAVYRWLGSHYYNENEFLKASAYLAKGIELGRPDATPINVWRFLTKAQMKANLNEAAFSSVSSLLSLEEDKALIVDAMLDKAKIQMALGKDGDAKRTADDALEMNPTGRLKAELLLVIADFYFNIGQPAEAAKHYVLLVDSGKTLPEHAHILHRLSDTLQRSNNTLEAQRYAEMLKEKYPNYNPK